MVSEGRVVAEDGGLAMGALAMGGVVADCAEDGDVAVRGDLSAVLLRWFCGDADMSIYM